MGTKAGIPKEVEHGERFGSGFMGFIRQYQVAPLAIAVVIGTSVNELVKTIVDGLITPFISLISPTTKLQTFAFTLGKSEFKVGAIINAAISFMAVALVVYFFAKRVLRNDKLLEK